ncbi:hypothetical protein ACWDZX_18735 [Streptomyces collinus]
MEAQRRARHAQDGLRLTGEEERLYRLAHSLSDGYRCWVPGRPEELERLASLRWTTLRVDVLCGATGRADPAEQWASVFGTLEAVSDAASGSARAAGTAPCTSPDTASSPSPAPPTGTAATARQNCGAPTSPSPHLRHPTAPRARGAPVCAPCRYRRRRMTGA